MKMLLKNKIKIHKLRLRNKSLKELVRDYGWGGKGSKEDPYVIVPFDDVPLNLTLVTRTTYVKLKDLCLVKLNLYYCQNIIIENCKIGTLKMECCKNICIKNSSFRKVKLFLSRALKFENNEILDDWYNRLSTDFYEKRDTIYIYSGLLVGIICMVNIINSLITSNFSLLMIVNTILGFISLCGILYFVKLKLNMKNLLPNEYLFFKYKTHEFFENLFNVCLESQFKNSGSD